jgi:hypothetical protein
MQGLGRERTASALDIIKWSRAAVNGTIKLSGVASMKQWDGHSAIKYVSM